MSNGDGSATESATETKLNGDPVTVDENGKATLQVTIGDAWTVGESTIKAVYSGTDSGDLPWLRSSTDTTTVTVNSTPSHTTVSVDPSDSVTFGGTIGKIIAKVTDGDGAPVTAGTVTFLLDATDDGSGVQLGKTNVSGDGTSVLENITVSGERWKSGQHTITAKYSGIEQSPWYTGSEGTVALQVTDPRPHRLPHQPRLRHLPRTWG